MLLNAGVINVYITSTPPNNTVIVGREGAINITVRCSVFNSDATQLSTHWGLRHPDMDGHFSIPSILRGHANVSFLHTARQFHDRIIFLVFPIILNGYILTCGTLTKGGNPLAGQFPLLIYRKL